MEKIIGFYKAHTIIAIIITIIILYLLRRLFIKMKAKIDTKTLQDSIKGEIAYSAELGLKKSYTDTQYKAWADQLYNAMADYWLWYGTDEQAIISIMEKMKNRSDVISLVSAFGLRSGIIEGASGLGVWLKSELSSFYINQINDMFANKGIQYSF